MTVPALSAAELNARLTASGVSQEALAVAMDYDRSTLSRRLRGALPMPGALAERIHAALDQLEEEERAAEEARQRVRSERAAG